ncbi:hypothetical protein [Streptomyces sp. B6B3]|uniref:hypothetical protein n=1 Tax=Streptomyces sp. B6B3 TaxID=3153570 RepID=UPI00325F91BD
MFRRLRTLLALAAATAGVLVGTAGSAEAAPVPEDRDHCAIVLERGNPIPVRSGCFSDFRAEVRWLTEGAVTDAPRDRDAALADAALTGRLRTAQGTLFATDDERANYALIATEYEHENYGGASADVWGDGTCSNVLPVAEFSVARVGHLNPPPGQGFPWWNDRITSFRSYAGCLANHWQHDNWLGSNTGYRGPEVANIGESMNDETSSIQWT